MMCNLKLLMWEAFTYRAAHPNPLSEKEVEREGEGEGEVAVEREREREAGWLGPRTVGATSDGLAHRWR
jgi:hypothetical protein